MGETGLLDFLKSPEGQGLLAAGFGAMGSRNPWVGMSRGGLLGLQAYGQASEMQADRQRQQAMDERQTQVFDWQKSAHEQQQAAMAKQQQQQAAQQQFLESLNPNQMRLNTALGQGGGPTAANAAKLPDPVDPSRQMMWEAARNGVIPATDYIKTFLPDTEAYTLGEGQVRYKGGQVVAKGPEKPVDLPSSVREYNFAKGQGFNGSFQDWVMSQKRAAATSVNVNTDALGLKPKDRFEMEGKLSGDYEKATATDSAVLNATGKIRSAFTQAGALKDQAAIYAFAKMLDPDGAVREADYAAISGAAGLVDRVRNYTQKLLNGEQLTPTQRQEMIKLSDAFDQVANRRITDQRKRYSQQAERYNLRPDAVLTPQAPQQPKAAPSVPSQNDIAAELARRGIK